MHIEFFSSFSGGRTFEQDWPENMEFKFFSDFMPTAKGSVYCTVYSTHVNGPHDLPFYKKVRREYVSSSFHI